MHSEDVVVLVAGVVAGGVVAQWLGWRLRVPAIFFLLIGGLIAGPLTGALDPDKAFGDLLFPTVSLAVAVILFEGALGLGWRGVRKAGGTVWMLLTVGAGITLAGTVILARVVLGVQWELAALLAAVLVVTGPTVVGPIVRSIGLHGRLGAILEVEGTLIDPVGAILTVLVFQALFQATSDSGPIAVEALITLGIGAGIGVLAAVLLVLALARYLIPDQLHNVTTLAVVIGAFAAANFFREESGLVAVTVMGIALAGQKRVSVRHVLEFNETLRILFISGLFLLLGARIELSTLRELEWRNIAFLIGLVILVRPVSVFFSTLGSDLTRNERIFLGLTAPRGIVAAAVASIFSLELAEVGVSDSQVLVSATFTVIIGTVVMSALASRALANKLQLVEPDRNTILVLGANPVARAFASALDEQGADVRLIDLDRSALAAARMTGLPAHRGSVFADETWEDVGIESAACFVAMTSNDELNTLATRHAGAILGRKAVYQLPPRRPEHGAWWTLPTGSFARPLFGVDANLDVLSSRLEDGWRVASTRLTDKFGPQEYANVHPDATTLFVVDSKGSVEILASDLRRRLKVGDLVVALAKPVNDPKPPKAGDEATPTEVTAEAPTSVDG